MQMMTYASMALAVLFGCLAFAFYLQMVAMRWTRNEYAENLRRIRAGFRSALAEALMLAAQDSGEFWATVTVLESDDSVDEVRIGRSNPRTELRVLCFNWHAGQLNDISVQTDFGARSHQMPEIVPVSHLDRIITMLIADVRSEYAGGK